jgi:uncharacterized protein (TIGR02996 family)
MNAPGEALMDVEAGFLDDVLDNPDDDAPRLIYADWLSDRGRTGDEARAELIRVQCQLARSASGLRTRAWLDLRVAQMLPLYEENWLPNELHSPRQGEWRRGFFCVQTRLWPFICGAQRWFLHPAVLEARVDVRGSHDGGLLDVDEDHVRFLGETPLLARVTQLSVRGRPFTKRPLQGDDFALAVAGSPHARRLRQLELSCFSDRGASALLESAHLRSLKSLTLWSHVEISAATRRRLQARFAVTP